MSEKNKAQIECWNGRAGAKWASLHVWLDAMLTHATVELRSRVGSVAGQRVLDIGCGAGETCEIWLDGGAEVTGVDISAPMLAVAAQRTGNRGTFLQADAAVWRAETPFDLAVSRFGMMFFDDPASAFATIAANLRPGGRLLFMCWCAAADNEWVTTPMNAIRDLLPAASPPAPHAPGPFALADRERVQALLEGAGLREIVIERFDFPVCVAGAGGVEEAVRLVMQIGPSGAALAEASDEVKAAAAERLKVSLAPHQRDGCVTMAAATWLIEAVRAG